MRAMGIGITTNVNLLTNTEIHLAIGKLSEWLIIVFYAVSAIFQPCNGGTTGNKRGERKTSILGCIAIYKINGMTLVSGTTLLPKAWLFKWFELFLCRYKTTCQRRRVCSLDWPTHAWTCPSANPCSASFGPWGVFWLDNNRSWESW